MVLNSFLNPVLGPLLSLPVFFVLLIISFIISLAVTLAYKFFTDQKLMKQTKDDIKLLQAEAKANKADLSKVADINKQMMQLQMRTLTQSFRITLITLLPIILIFSWLSAVIAYEPLRPEQPFTVAAYSDVKLNFSSTPSLEILKKEERADSTAWTLSGSEGIYTLWYEYDGGTSSNDIIITDNREYKNPKVVFKDSRIKMVDIGNQKTAPFGNFTIFGYRPGWLMTYIILSLVFSLGLRKIMNVQ